MSEVGIGIFFFLLFVIWLDLRALRSSQDRSREYLYEILMAIGGVREAVRDNTEQLQEHQAK